MGTYLEGHGVVAHGLHGVALGGRGDGDQSYRTAHLHTDTQIQTHAAWSGGKGARHKSTTHVKWPSEKQTLPGSLTFCRKDGFRLGGPYESSRVGGPAPAPPALAASAWALYATKAGVWSNGTTSEGLTQSNCGTTDAKEGAEGEGVR